MSSKLLTGSVTFSIDGSSVGSSSINSSGVATLSPTVTQAPGNHHVTASFASTSGYFGNSATATSTAVTVQKEDTSLSYTGPTQLAEGSTPTVTALLKEDGTTPIQGRSVQIAIGSGTAMQSCGGTTTSSGVASCTLPSIKQTQGAIPIAASFTGDTDYSASSDTGKQATVFSWLATGAHVIGDKTATAASGTTTPVIFWSGQWARLNSLTGGVVTPVFFGFARSLASSPPVCNQSWTSTVPQSLTTPKTLPAYMGVIVASQITRAGVTVTGDVYRLAVVKTAGPTNGTGTLVALFCPATRSAAALAADTLTGEAQTAAAQHRSHRSSRTVHYRHGGPRPWLHRIRTWSGHRVLRDQISKTDQQIQFGSVGDHTYGDSPFTISATSVYAQALPPDPSTVAPPTDQTIPTDIFGSTAFLYTGPNPIQTGVAPGTITLQRVAVLRGRVLNTDGTALPGVTVIVLNHPEYGQTLSRSDGQYDLAVNGGGPTTLNFTKDGYLPAQREVMAPWHDYMPVPDVALMPFDPHATDVTFSPSTTTFQMTQGSQDSDSRGTRQTSMLVQPGTTATMVMPDGSTHVVGDAHLRITEFTVGSNGQTAMPASLPPTSAYTYCIDITSDEAEAAGAAGMTFSKPTIVYLQNFLGVKVGTPVPVGSYDATSGQWIPQENGLVIKILSITSSEASLDVDGSGNPATSAQYQALGITDAERQQLAGTSLWRIDPGGIGPIDGNFGNRSQPIDNNDIVNLDTLQRILATKGMPDAAAYINKAKDDGLGTLYQQNQILGEDQSITGTPLRLHYSSDRQPDYTAGYTLPIPLTGSVVPDGLNLVELQVSVAGRTFFYQFAPTNNLTFPFTWDGKDAYGRQLQGPQPVSIEVVHQYPPFYDLPSDVTNAFGKYTGIIYEGHAAGTIFCGGAAALRAHLRANAGETCAPPVYTYQFFDTEIGDLIAKPVGLGGWDLDIHNTYDPGSHILYFGAGSEESASSISHIITHYAGSGASSDSGDGGPAASAGIVPRGLAAGPDGSVYFIDSDYQTIRRIAPDGTISTFAGLGPRGGDPSCATDWWGDGCPAIDASLFGPDNLAVGPDGSLYFTEHNSGTVRRLTPDGIMHIVAGHYCGYGYACGDPYATGTDVPATSATLADPRGLAVAPDGTIYVAEYGANRITQISTGGYMSTVAGAKGTCNYFNCEGPDNVAAFDSDLYAPLDVALGPDGSLYILSCGGHDIRKIDPGGVITSLTGPCGFDSPALDGQPATDGGTGYANYIAVDRQGNVFFSYYIPTGGPICFDRISEITAAGISQVIAGKKNDGYGCAVGGDGGPASQAILNSPEGLAIGPDGSLYYAELYYIRHIAPPLPGFDTSDIVIPSPDGSQIYRFDSTDRHLQTLDALTGAVILTFGYDSKTGELTSVTDAYGNATTVTHDANGNPTSIISPYNDVTTLTTDANGFLASVSDPLHHGTGYAYSSGGLLASETGPNGNTFSFTYDAQGRIVNAAEPVGGNTALSTILNGGIVDGGTETKIKTTSALGRTVTYDENNLSTTTSNTITLPNSTVTKQSFSNDGTITDTDPAGMQDTRVLAPDPRFGMGSPYRSSHTLSSPGGLTRTTTDGLAVTLSDPNDPLSLQSLTGTATVGGKQWTTVYTQSDRTLLTTSPLGREAVTTLDSQGRPINGQGANLAPYSITYDDHGRMSTVTSGTGGEARTTTYSYGSNGRLQSVTDPVGRTISYTYDAADHITSETIPGQGAMQFAYDPNGNQTQITTPGARVFQISYDQHDRLSAFTPPSVGGDSPTIGYSYNADRQLASVSRSDGQDVSYSHSAVTGQLTKTTLPEGSIGYAYDPVTGSLTGTTAPNSVGTSFTYDGDLPVGTSWSGPVQGSTGTTYDNFFRTSSESINGGNAVSYGYDDDGLLTSAGSLSISRDATNGLMTGFGIGNLAGSRTYDDFGELAGQQESLNGNALYGVSYTRDALGRIKSRTETINGTSHTFSYTYDLQSGRLTNVAQDGTNTESYTYDSDGNRLTGPGVSTPATYDARGELTQYGSTGYTYNVGGQLTSKTDSSGQTTYSYDPVGWLLGVNLPSGKSISYLLSGAGIRIGKEVNGTLTQGYLYDQADRLVGLLDGNNNLLAQYVYAGGESPSYMVANGNTYRIISDQLGSPRPVVDAGSGQIMEQIDYDSFGNPTVSNIASGWDANLLPFCFAGGLYDPDTGLVRMGLRDYDPQTGRCTTPDPLGLGAGDLSTLYGYAFGDPVNLADPTGEGVSIDRHGKPSTFDPWAGSTPYQRQAATNPGRTFLTSVVVPIVVAIPIAIAAAPVIAATPAVVATSYQLGGLPYAVGALSTVVLYPVALALNGVGAGAPAARAFDDEAYAAGLANMAYQDGQATQQAVSLSQAKQAADAASAYANDAFAAGNVVQASNAANGAYNAQQNYITLQTLYGTK